MLAMKEMGNKLGGIPAEVTLNDDQFKPDVARQLADKLVKKDQVDVVTGLLSRMSCWRCTTRSSIEDGPDQLERRGLAGRGQDVLAVLLLFGLADRPGAGAVGQYVTKTGAKTVFIIASNYQAGQDAANGFKRQFEGQVVGEVFRR
jgi:branched-chain amino acid transport system substrate-binding protein